MEDTKNEIKDFLKKIQNNSFFYEKIEKIKKFLKERSCHK